MSPLFAVAVLIDHWRNCGTSGRYIPAFNAHKCDKPRIRIDPIAIRAVRRRPPGGGAACSDTGTLGCRSIRERE